MLNIQQFEVRAQKHAEEASPEVLVWKVFVLVKFASDDPTTWGELRAYGGSWTRRINRTHTYDFAQDESFADPSLRANPAKDEVAVQLIQKQAYPFWGHAEGPRKSGEYTANRQPAPRAAAVIDANEYGFSREWHLDDDGHIEIFYARSFPAVPRSNRCDPDYNDPKTAVRSGEIDLTAWHIVGRDEPQSSSFHTGDYVEYWHQAEFQIVHPKTKAIEQRRRLFLRVRGNFPAYAYSKLDM